MRSAGRIKAAGAKYLCRARGSAPRAVFLVLGKRLLGLVGRLFALQAVAEGADALGGVAHKAGDLAAAAEQQRRRDDDRKDVPDAKGAHALNSPWVAPLWRTPVLFTPLYSRSGERKPTRHQCAPSSSPRKSTWNSGASASRGSSSAPRASGLGTAKSGGRSSESRPAAFISAMPGRS